MLQRVQFNDNVAAQVANWLESAGVYLDLRAGNCFLVFHLQRQVERSRCTSPFSISLPLLQPRCSCDRLHIVYGFEVGSCRCDAMRAYTLTPASSVACRSVLAMLFGRAGAIESRDTAL